MHIANRVKVGLVLAVVTLGWVGACSDSPTAAGRTVVALAVSPSTATIVVGDTLRLTATPRDAVGSALPGRAVVWSSDSPQVATVSLDGLVTGLAGGAVTITATSEGARGQALVTVGDPPPPSPQLVVSNAVRQPAVSLSSALLGLNASREAASDSVAFVSLTPGAAPTGVTATVQSPVIGQSLTTVMSDGGFDPVAIGARVGDSILTVVRDDHGAVILEARIVVAAARRPIVVRTDPPPRKRDVPLNAAIVIVFSEPVDQATLTSSSVALLQGSTSVAGTVRLLDAAGLTAVFEPAGLLASNADYRLVVTSAVRDLSGSPLEAPVATDFRTSDAVVGAPASVTVSPSLAEGFFPLTTLIRAYVRDAQGNALVGSTVQWTSSDSSIATVSAPTGGQAWLTLRAGGVARIAATSEGQADTALVVSRPLPLGIATGALRVAAATTGPDPDPNGYDVIVDGGPAQPVATNDSITIGGLSVGTHTVALAGVAANCAIADSLGSQIHPRTVTIMGGDTVQTTIAVACTPRTGTLRVIVTTTGDSLDVNGYIVAVAATGEYAHVQPIGLNDTVTFVGLPLGEVWIHLFDVAANCTVSGGDNVRPVTIAPDAANEYAYTVACAGISSAGAVALATTTTGVDIDRDGYWVSIDDGALFVSMNATYRTVISPLESGTHTVFLYMVSSNCHIAGDNPRTVIVSAGDTTEVAFEITCSAAERIALDGTYCTPSPLCYPVVLVTFADGSNTNVIASYGQEPAWSPVGDRIAFTSVDGDINVVTYDGLVGGTITRLTTHSANDRSPAWSPDGSRIAFASERDGQPELYLMNPDGSAVFRVTSGVGFVGQPAWSPDGTRIAFDCEVETGNRDICAVNVDGTGLTRLTNDAAPDFDPAWSPDGARIAFATGRYEALPEIAVLTVTGGGVTRVRAGSSGVQPSWSPDGTRIAFSQNLGGVYVMNADGSGLALLRQGANPAWKPAQP